MSNDRMCLLAVHAHPDDESSQGSATIARYHDEGVETVLVCCTGGEAGEILNPAMDREEIRANLAAVRKKELAKATSIIGFDHVELLGYRDSGMPGTPENEDPRSFARASAGEATGKLVAILRKYRPDVVITYGDDQEFYPHPDHLRAHDVTVAAFTASSDADAYPEAGEPWAPGKLYYTVLSFERFGKMYAEFKRLGYEWPFEDSWHMFPNNDHRITTRIDVSEWRDVRAEALRAHASQIDPESQFWFGLSIETEKEIFREDDYTLARSTVETSFPETDLFAGLREQA